MEGEMEMLMLVVLPLERVALPQQVEVQAEVLRAGVQRPGLHKNVVQSSIPVQILLHELQEQGQILVTALRRLHSSRLLVVAVLD